MLSSVALRAQIASIIDALSEAAVAEIAKVVEDGMVVLRLEMCQRETEIRKLKSNFEVLHGELRALRESESATPRPDTQRAVGDERASLEKNHNHTDRNGLRTPELQVKCEPVDEASEENRSRPARPAEDASPYERHGAQWRPAAQTGRVNSGYSHSGQNSLSCLPESSLSGGQSAGFQPSPFIRGLPGYGQYRGPYGAARRRTAAAAALAKRFMFKKGFICPYCGKCFERGGHLERHKRIHTGEKPYRCEECGRRFNQKCSLKEHMKIHGRCVQPNRAPEVEVGDRKPVPEGKPCPGAPRPEEGVRGNAADVPPKNEDLLATPVHVKREPAEEDITAPPPFLGGNEQTRERADGGGGG
ncbi:replication initiator 1-like, partial [Cyclopterus lumpus]|uniref:replication initiator 1-like n=1 Tax=Cyclopterus lumpus TaxID=8103 RepID=UPI001487036E